MSHRSRITECLAIAGVIAALAGCGGGSESASTLSANPAPTVTPTPPSDAPTAEPSPPVQLATIAPQLVRGGIDLVADPRRNTFYVMRQSPLSANGREFIPENMDARTGISQPVSNDPAISNLDTQTVFGFGGTLALTGNGETLFINKGNEIVKVNVSTSAIEQRIPVALSPAGPAIEAIESFVPAATPLTALTINVGPDNPDLLLVASKANSIDARYVIRQLYIGGRPLPGLYADHAQSAFNLRFGRNDTIILDSDAPNAPTQVRAFDKSYGISNIVRSYVGSENKPLSWKAAYIPQGLLSGNKVLHPDFLFPIATIPGATDCAALSDGNKLACFGPNARSSNARADHVMFVYDLQQAKVTQTWALGMPPTETQWHSYSPRFIQYGGSGTVGVVFAETGRAGFAGHTVIGLYRDAALD